MKNILLILLFIYPFSAKAENKLEIYVGEPFMEALPDLLKVESIIIAASIPENKPFSRNDTFLLKDGRILFIQSQAGKAGDRFSIVKIAILKKEDLTNIPIDKIIFLKSFNL